MLQGQEETQKCMKTSSSSAMDMLCRASMQQQHGERYAPGVDEGRMGLEHFHDGAHAVTEAGEHDGASRCLQTAVCVVSWATHLGASSPPRQLVWYAASRPSQPLRPLDTRTRAVQWLQQECTRTAVLLREHQL